MQGDSLEMGVGPISQCGRDKDMGFAQAASVSSGTQNSLQVYHCHCCY